MVKPSLVQVEMDDDELLLLVDRSSISAERIRASNGEGDGVKDRDHRTRPPWVL